METRNYRPFLLAAFILFPVLATALFLFRPDHARYEIESIWTSGAANSAATVINEKGWVGGHITFIDGMEAPIIWTSSEGVRTIDLPTADSARLMTIDESGRAVGCRFFGYTDRPIETEALAWDVDSSLTSLKIDSASESRAFGILESGAVAGSIDYATGRVFGVWNSLGEWIPDKETIQDATGVNIRKANRRGHRVGVISGEETMVAFLWPNGKEIHSLGVLQGNYSHALDVNDNLQVVGLTESASHSQVAFLWEEGRMSPLETPTDGTSSRAYAINNQGQVVGSVFHPIDSVFGITQVAYRKILSKDHKTYHDNEYAVLWEDGKLHYLNELISRDSGWDLICAEDINDAGQIVGWGLYRGEERGFVMTPVGKAEKVEEP
ncbi:MAG: DUF3466 family protein [Candidatus Omnitrophica bacterium]|nr:DUF3466 family protein [Candidatus Omnitrophota bacterium]MCB9782591.1 DUF3466 family protein [Candidatus Omnitrophota bacterium]